MPAEVTIPSVLRSLLRRDNPVSALAPESGPAVVLTRGGESAAAHVLRTECPGLTVTEVPVGERAWARIAGLGPVVLLVDDTGDPGSALSRFRRHFLLVAEGGTYVVPSAARPALSALAAGPTAPPEDPEEAADRAERALAAAMGAVEEAGGWVGVARVGRTVAKLREAETTAAVKADTGRGAVLARVEAASFDSRCDFREMLPLSARAKQHYDAPPAVLRRYDGALCAPHALVVQRGIVTADSFRHHPQKWLKNDRLSDLDRRHAEEPTWMHDELPVLEGAWYHLDNEHRGHFGHVLTEQVARLWAWDDALLQEPDLQVLVASNRHRPGVAGWELTLLEAAGIERDRVTVIDAPVRVERLYGATPLFSMPYYVHPHITQTWDRIGRTLRSEAPERDYPRRIFCSRKIKKRSCHNAREVDAFFADHGFEVVFPEEYSLPEQAALFHEAEVVAGFAGSALFNVMFTDRRKHLISVASETYTPRNEYLISALRGHRLDMSHSRPDENDPKFHTKRFMSSFTFDFDREGRWLHDEVLAHL